jgi:hypothetical protein
VTPGITVDGDEGFGWFVVVVSQYAPTGRLSVEAIS